MEFQNRFQEMDAVAVHGNPAPGDIRKTRHPAFGQRDEVDRRILHRCTDGLDALSGHHGANDEIVLHAPDTALAGEHEFESGGVGVLLRRHQTHIKAFGAKETLSPGPRAGRRTDS